MQFKPLRTLLEQGYSLDACRAVTAETASLYRELLISRWYFLLLNRIFCQIIDNPDFIEADTVDPILDSIFKHALQGLDAAEQGDTKSLILCANQLVEAYTAIP